MEVVQRGVVRTRILQPVSALEYIFPKRLPRGDSIAIGQNPLQPKRIALQSATKISNAIPWPAGRDEKMRLTAENRSPRRKNCGFDVTGPDKLTLTWHPKKKPLF
jgi:hypothetical protein